MKKYTVRAIYKAVVELEVEVEEGVDASRPANWKEIQSEHQTDYFLHDVESVSEGWK
jgi:hypothetical protein